MTFPLKRDLAQYRHQQRQVRACAGVGCIVDFLSAGDHQRLCVTCTKAAENRVYELKKLYPCDQRRAIVAACAERDGEVFRG